MFQVSGFKFNNMKPETIKTLNKNKDDFRNESPITRGVNKRS